MSKRNKLNEATILLDYTIYCPNCNRTFCSMKSFYSHLKNTHPEFLKEYSKEYSILAFNPSRRGDGVWA